MRPIELILKNFLSYGETPQTVNFSEYTIISFIGNNGHGKSAILESITWALWGMARRSQGVTKSDDMIMHTGSSDMFVSLTFQVKNQLYRVKRICQKKHNRLYSNLEFYLIEGPNQEKNLSLNHQRGTQEIIDSIIGIDYETFINTVYLKQGQSNEFSKKTPKERKDILCSILKINEIEKIREAILADIKILLQERTLQKTLQERFNIEEKNNVLQNQKELLESIKKNQENEGEIVSLIKQEWEENKNNLEKIELLFSKEKEHTSILEKEYNSLHNNYLLYEGEYKKYKRYFIEAADLLIKQNNRKLDDETLLQHKIKLTTEKLSLFQENVEKEKSEIYRIHNDQLMILQQEYLENHTANRTEETKEYLLGRKKYLEEIILQCKNNTEQCFFCQQTILESHTFFRKSCSEYEKEKTKLEEKILKKKSEQKENEADFQEAKALIEKNLKINLDILQKNTLEKVQKIKQEKKIFEEAYEEALASFKDKKKIELYLQEIKEIKKKINNKTIKDIIIQMYTVKRNLSEQKIKKETLEKSLEEFSKKYKEIEKTYLSLQEKKQVIEKQKTEKEQYISFLEEQLEKDKSEDKKITIRLKELEDDLEIRSNLAHLLSKNNLQAILIEEAIPLIENEANNILDKLTEGKCKIYIDSMRDLKSGEIKETLDIKIADAFGLRYYEFFSGGESFKIDLALRIALVKLLTQKSGHAIRTFIIDEGFGSQDTQSLEKMIDVLYALQNEFDLIILISHLVDMKEQFPGQFFIRKTPTGSLIQKM